MGSFGFEEMVLVLIVAIMLFGRELPDIARKAGRWYRDIKRKIEDLKSEVKRQIPEVDLDSDYEEPSTRTSTPPPPVDPSKPFDPAPPAPLPPPVSGDLKPGP